MNIGCIIQARTRSARFPRKIYEDINGKYTLQRVLEEVSQSASVNKIILAMPHYDQDEFLQRFYIKGEFDEFVDNRFATYFGEPDDVLARYYNAAKAYRADIIVRICADSPLIQGSLIDEMVNYYKNNNLNGFLGNIRIGTKPYPAGIAIEIFPFWLLEQAHIEAKEQQYREHVTPYMFRDSVNYTVCSYDNLLPHTIINDKYKNFSFDTPDDLSLIKEIVTGYDKHKDLNKAISECEWREKNV